MRTEQARPVRLQDYRPPDWLVDRVHLDVSLHPTAARVRSTLSLRPNPATRARARWCWTATGSRCRRFCVDGKPLAPDGLSSPRPDRLTLAQPPQRAVRADDRDHRRSLRQYPIDGAVPVERHLLHAMRGRRLPPHHLFPGPAGRDGGLHDPHRGRQGAGAGTARQRQSDRKRRPAGRPAFRGLARSVSEAVLSVRDGRRRARLRRRHLRHHVRPQGRAENLCRARQGRPLRLCDGLR